MSFDGRTGPAVQPNVAPFGSAQQPRSRIKTQLRAPKATVLKGVKLPIFVLPKST
jgi:hypothetical protein